MSEMRPSFPLDSYQNKPLELYNFIEKLYVSGGKYELTFQELHLPVVEKIFDQIVLKYGLNGQTDISYRINSDSSANSS